MKEKRRRTAMYYSEHGAGSLPTVILLHGAFFTEAFGRRTAIIW